jgi:hypothetical protein
MRVFRRTQNPNAVAGIFLLMMLAVIAGPNTLRSLITTILPSNYTGVPCDWLRNGDDRAQHQSLIGRSVSSDIESPIGLRIETGPLPATADGSLAVTITVINRSIGTVPFVFNPAVILGGGTGENGVGVAFGTAQVPAASNVVNSYPASQIHLLGPRQHCIYSVQIPSGQLDPSLGTGAGVIKAFYRNNSTGAVTQVGTEPLIYTDQGLWVGVVESAAVTVPLGAQ